MGAPSRSAKVINLLPQGALLQFSCCCSITAVHYDSRGYTNDKTICVKVSSTSGKAASENGVRLSVQNKIHIFSRDLLGKFALANWKHEVGCV